MSCYKSMKIVSSQVENLAFATTKAEKHVLALAHAQAASYDKIAKTGLMKKPFDAIREKPSKVKFRKKCCRYIARLHDGGKHKSLK